LTNGICGEISSCAWIIVPEVVVMEARFLVIILPREHYLINRIRASENALILVCHP